MAAVAPVALRQYRFSDGLLEQLADHVIQIITRDLAQLAPRGINAGTITQLQNLRNNFVALPTGTEAQALISEAVEAKNAAREAALVMMRRLRTAAQNVYGQGQGSYNRLKLEGIDRLSDDLLPRALATTQRVAAALQPALAAEGIDSTFLSDYALAITNYSNAITGVDIAGEERDRMTEERLTAGNILYRQTVRLCNTGKDVFAGVSEALYNDYVIERFTGTGSRAVTRKGALQASETKDIGIEKLTMKPATRIHVFAPSAVGLRWYFAATAGGAHAPDTPFADTGPGTDLVYLAGELGYSPQRPYLTVLNMADIEGAYKVIVGQ